MAPSLKKTVILVNLKNSFLTVLIHILLYKALLINFAKYNNQINFKLNNGINSKNNKLLEKNVNEKIFIEYIFK